MEFLVECISLKTPKGRLTTFLVITILVFFAPYNRLSHLSAWPMLGWKSAPSIGLTRAYHLFLHGKILLAWHRNWLIYPVITIWVFILAKDMIKIYQQKRFKLSQSF